MIIIIIIINQWDDTIKNGDLAVWSTVSADVSGLHDVAVNR